MGPTVLYLENASFTSNLNEEIFDFLANKNLWICFLFVLMTRLIKKPTITYLKKTITSNNCQDLKKNYSIKKYNYASVIVYNQNIN